MTYEFLECRSSFRNHILTIVFMCAFKEMIWIYAVTIVTSMAYQQNRWNLSEMQFPRISMRNLISAINSHATISSPVLQSCPYPAIIRMRF